jgi:hypothetical protein
MMVPLKHLGGCADLGGIYRYILTGFLYVLEVTELYGANESLRSRRKREEDRSPQIQWSFWKPWSECLKRVQSSSNPIQTDHVVNKPGEGWDVLTMAGKDLFLFMVAIYRGGILAGTWCTN